jgi:rubrerythrin
MTTEITKVLNDLLQLDIDAVNAYDLALKHIDDRNVYKTIRGFRQDHLQHMSDLTKFIKKYDGIPIEYSPDLKGYLIEGITILRSVTDTKGALNAMESNEKITTKNYNGALQENLEFPNDIKDLLLKNFMDENRHLEYITNTLKNWKKVYEDERLK